MTKRKPKNQSELAWPSKKDWVPIAAIAKRAFDLVATPGLDLMSLEMDIGAAHANGCKLDLDKLLKADDFNLCHDVFGISRHLDRNTGELTGWFVPRCAMPTKKEKQALAKLNR